jgi:integrase
MKRGMGRTFKRGSIWWISFYHHGKEVRESSKSESESAAVKLLKQRLAQSETGQFVTDEKKVTFDNMVEWLKADYKLNDLRSLESGALVNVSHLRQFFGFDKAIAISTDRIRAYQLRRREQGAATASINRECATLRRMFSIAIELGKLKARPKFTMLDGETVREGFVEHGDFLRLVPELPDHIRPLIEFLYFAGWRKSAARNLEWREIDMRGRTARLKIADAKNKEPWILPLAGRLWDIVQERAKARRLSCPHVFHLDGKKIGDFRKAWTSACKRAGLSGLLIHDLRRSCARHLSKAGVKEQIAMKITGHKTNSMYRRYRIVDEDEIRQALDQTQAHLDATADAKVAMIGT